MQQQHQSVDELFHAKSPVIIFGAGTVGKIILDLCSVYNIQVMCFCDTNADKIGTLYFDHNVLSCLDAVQAYPASPIIISSLEVSEIIQDINKYGKNKWILAGELLEHASHAVETRKMLSSDVFSSKMSNKYIYCHSQFLKDDAICMNNVDIVITERCSLKCKDCSNLMQYYTNPQNYTCEDIKKNIESLLPYIDSIYDLRIIGGEPFMNKDIAKILRMLSIYEKIQIISIYSNGTIIPSSETLEICKERNIVFHLTDYGHPSQKIDTIQELFESWGIEAIVSKADSWMPCSSITRRNRTKEQAEAILFACCAKNITTIIGNHMYRCPFVANAMNLSAIPRNPLDIVDLSLLETLPAAQSRKNIRDFLSRTWVPSCDYCAGRSFDSPAIPPAIQAAAPLAYTPVSDT